MRPIEPIGLEAARQLLHFGGPGFSEAIAEEQLRGTTALHNILGREGFAYLADEVGMGKTYVALGVVALLRLFHPELRVLVVAPTANIQLKWQKELRNFTRANWLHRDQRVRSIEDLPCRPYASCDSLLDWAWKATARPAQDFFVRLTSFSFALGKETQSWDERRERLRELAPHYQPELFDLRGGSKDKLPFKRAFAQTLNGILPHYDLVIVDEAHNLKHGAQSHSSRNLLLSLALGSCPGVENAPYYRRRFDRVLFLSATPFESEYGELWRQLDLFGFGERARELVTEGLSDEARTEAARRFLIRRLTGLRIEGRQFTKNMYRREWRKGGCVTPDAPLEVPSAKQRLVVALVQKKVAEVIHQKRFNASFQMGMLASFESFLETMKRRAPTLEAEGAFDGSEQTQDETERDGIDTPTLGRLAESYRRRFREPLPHPKMDAVVRSIASCFGSGEKALVFVRRVKSVPEMRGKLCRDYDRWLHAELRRKLASELHEELDQAFRDYERHRDDRAQERHRDDMEGLPAADQAEAVAPTEDEGGSDTFFSWFFRGAGPRPYLSGASFRKNRLNNSSSAYSIVFEDNAVMELLGVRGEVVEALARTLWQPVDVVREQVRALAFTAWRRSSKKAKGHSRLKVFHAHQAAALQLLARAAHASTSPELAGKAALLLRHLHPGPDLSPTEHVPPDFPRPDEHLDTRTFFTELRARPGLREELWPEPRSGSYTDRLREQEQRRLLLANVARLGHASIDLWALAVNRLGALRSGRQDRESEDRAEAFIEDLLQCLERQRTEPGLHAWRELREVGQHHDLIVSTNFPEVRQVELSRAAQIFSTALGSQTPVGGMYGGVNKTLVTQFRMPGYPLVLLTTEVLQEGEDLHTFCARIIHYGISWTPSAMEQRTGRIDRINSLVHRRLDGRAGPPTPEELLQVQYPYLGETVEVLQVERVFEKLNRFLRMAHRTAAQGATDSQVRTREEFVRTRRDIEPIPGPLETAFPVKAEHLEGTRTVPAELREHGQRMLEHLDGLCTALERESRVLWHSREPGRADRHLTTFIAEGVMLRADDSRVQDGISVRQQPVVLSLRPASATGFTLLRAVSPIGKLDLTDEQRLQLARSQEHFHGARLCEVATGERDTYSLTVESDLFFDARWTEAEELFALVRSVSLGADAAERMLFPSQDAPYSAFQQDLTRETRRAAD